MRDFRVLLGVLLAAATAAPLPARQPTMASETEVTLAIFSGRVDPVWVLTRAEAAEFRKRLLQLPKAPQPHPPPARLGYLSVLLPDPGHARQSVTIDHGRVVWTDHLVLRSLLDPDRSLEAWLLKTGAGRTALPGRWFAPKDLDGRL